MDARELAAVFATEPANTRIRQGEVVSIEADHTITITMAGSATQIAGVKYAASYCPRVGAGVWLVLIGASLFAIASLADEGPAWATLRLPGTQTIANAAGTDVSFTATPTGLIDEWGMLDTGDPDHLSVTVPGLYLVTFSCSWASNATGYRQLAIMQGAVYRFVERRNPLNGVATLATISGILDCAVGDEIIIEVYQNSGGNLNLTASSEHENALTVAYLGPAYSG